MDSVSEAADADENLRRKRKRRAGFSDAASKSDRLPPHSPEAEQGVLGCIILSPRSCIDQAREKIKRSEAFYDLRHQTIWDVALELCDENKAAFDGEPFDLITLQERLKKRKLLEKCGGLAYLTSLPDPVPSTANLGYYLEIVCEKYEFRKRIQHYVESIERIYNHEGDANDLLDDLDEDYGNLKTKVATDLIKTSTWGELRNYDTDNDPNCVIGFHHGKTTRFLCKGHLAWIIGPSGAGKSSLQLLMAASFAIGESLWGIAVGKPLRVLLVQAENDEGDLSEMAKGIDAGLKLTEFGSEERDELLKKNFICRSAKGKIGKHFCDWLEKEIMNHRADLVIVDPLLSFAGIEVAQQNQVTEFLRLWLDPVLFRTGAVMLSVHHTGKPKTEKPKSAPTLLDQAYAGIGSSELVNYARAIMLVQQVDDYNFKLILAKRGRRAWATHPGGEFTQILWLRHAQNGIFWDQVEPPQESDPNEKEAKAGRPSVIHRVLTLGLGKVIDNLSEGVSQNVFAQMICDFCETKNETVSRGSAQKIITQLVANNAVIKRNGMYAKI